MSRVRFLVPEIGWYSILKLKEQLTDLSTLQCYVRDTKFNPKKGDLVVNYGCIKYPAGWEERFGDHGSSLLNRPELVRISTNRRTSLPILRDAGVRVPEWTQYHERAIEWLDGGNSILCRQNKRSYGGAGISYVEPGQPLPKDQALYVKYRPKKTEYRVHIFGGKAIDLQEKRRRSGFEGKVNYQIRSYDNGWVLCRENVHMPDECIDQSIRAVAALGLDFGATDVGWNETTKKATVYEVNTAPGLTGTTIQRYAEAIRGYYNELG